jgi:hypothetical protein
VLFASLRAWKGILINDYLEDSRPPSLAICNEGNVGPEMGPVGHRTIAEEILVAREGGALKFDQWSFHPMSETVPLFRTLLLNKTMRFFRLGAVSNYYLKNATAVQSATYARGQPPLFPAHQGDI